MKHTRNKMVALLLALLMLLASTGAVAEDVPTVTALIKSYSGIIPPEKNYVTEGILEAIGVNAKIDLVVSSDDFKNKMATLTASKSLPDIIFGSRTDIMEMAQYGVVQPLDDLLASVGQDIVADKGDTFGAYKLDGQVYAIPVASAESLQPVRIGMRKDWLDNLKMEVPSTVDELYNALYAFTYNDPDGDGQNNTGGLCISLNSVNTWKYGIAELWGISVRYENYVDGQVLPALLHPNYLEMIKFINKLYQDGLMEPDFATRPWMEVAGELWSGKYGAIAFGPIGTSNNWLTRYTDPNVEWVYLDITGPYGHNGSDNAFAGLGDCVAINSKCENPEAAMKLLNYLVTEAGQDLMILGVEGTHYKSNEDGSVSYLPPYAADLTAQRNEGGAAYVNIMGSLKNCATMKTLNAVTSEAVTNGLSKTIDQAILFTTPQIELDMGGVLGDIEKEAYASLVVTTGDIEAEYNSYVDKWLRSGGEEWIKQATEIYNNQNK